MVVEIKERKKQLEHQTKKILTILTTVYNCDNNNKGKTFSLHWYWNISACSYYT